MQLRVARHTHNIKKLTQFYVLVFNFEVLGNFENHNNYNGVFLGKKRQSWHIEFTESLEKVNPIFNEDNLWVFYPKTQQEYNIIINTIKQNQIPIHQAKNPYWNNNGMLIKDPDGYGIIISPLKIEDL